MKNKLNKYLQLAFLAFVRQPTVLVYDFRSIVEKQSESAGPFSYTKFAYNAALHGG